MNQVIQIITALTSLVASIAPLIEQAVQAYNAADQATLDQIQKQAVAASEALKPPGASTDLPVA